MVEVIVKKKYSDIELDRKVLENEKLELSPLRAKKLASMGLIEIIKINKLSKKEYEDIKSHQEG